MQERHGVRHRIMSPVVSGHQLRRLSGPQTGSLNGPTRGNPLVTVIILFHFVDLESPSN